MNEIITFVKNFMLKKRSGKITINIFKGGITSWNVLETFKAKNSK